MPFHVIIMPADAAQRRTLGEAFANDKDTAWLNERVVLPWERGEALLIGGRTFAPADISQITITETTEPSAVLTPQLPATPGVPVPAGLLVALGGDNVTDQFITGPPGTRPRQHADPAADPTVDPKNVMVIYGHDTEAKDALFDWLRRIELRPLEFNELVRATGTASPYTGDAVRNAFNVAQAVIAFFTPDEYVLDRTTPVGSQNTWRLQARPNVLIEAGMALITHPDRTVIVILGPQELPSDLAGRNYVRLNRKDVEPLQDLATRLREVAHCDARLTGTDWLNPKHFPDRYNLPPRPPTDSIPLAAPAELWPASIHDRQAYRQFIDKLPPDGPVIGWLKLSFMTSTLPIDDIAALEGVSRSQDLDAIGFDNHNADRAYRDLSTVIKTFCSAVRYWTQTDDDYRRFKVPLDRREDDPEKWDKATTAILEGRGSLIESYDEFLATCHRNGIDYFPPA